MKDILDKLDNILNEGHLGMMADRVELDHEVQMARADLYKIAKYAMEIHDNIGDDDQLEGWVQSKIATVSSMIGSVKHYLEYEYKRGDHSVMEEDND